MNTKQIIILIGAVVVSALIVWHDLPLEFPGTMLKLLLLFFKISLVVAVTIFAYFFVGRKKKSGGA